MIWPDDNIIIMKSIAALISVGVVLGALYMSTPATVDIDSEFQQFVLDYRRSYFSQAEYNLRKQIFKDNLDQISQLNTEHPDATFGVNEFADLTFEEFSVRFGVRGTNAVEGERDDKVVQEAYPKRDWADSIDYREQDIIGPAKDQGSCGSCWTFSATGAIESNCNLVTGEHTHDHLSEEEMVMCASEKEDDSEYYECAGCNGGWMSRGVQYNVNKHGQVYDDVCPYIAKDQACSAIDWSKHETDRHCSVKKAWNFRLGSFEDLNNAIQDGTVAVGVNASPWMFYRGGVLKAEKCKSG